LIRNPRTRQTVAGASVLGAVLLIVSGCGPWPARSLSNPNSNSVHNTALRSLQNVTNSGGLTGEKLDFKSIV